MNKPSNMYPYKLHFSLSHPTNNWVEVSVSHADTELSFTASAIPENPVTQLCEAIILVAQGIDARVYWNTEPEVCTFDFSWPENTLLLKIISLDEIIEIEGNKESIILPLYRGIKKFATLIVDNKHWEIIDPTLLLKLKTQVKRFSRK